jgi:hypothetical protein
MLTINQIRETVGDQEERLTVLEQQVERIRLSSEGTKSPKVNPFGRLRHFYDMGVKEVTVYATNKANGEEEMIGEYETASRAKAIHQAKKEVNPAHYKNWVTIVDRG